MKTTTRLEPEPLTAADQLAAGEFVDRIMRPGSPTSMMEDFPLLVGPGAPSHRMVIRDAEGVVSHAAAYVHRYRLGPRDLSIAVLGAIATDPRARGRGLASRLVTALVERLGSDGVDLCLLWSQADALYERLGFVRAGRERLHVAWPLDLWELPRSHRVRRMRPDDLPAVVSLHDRREGRTRRDRATWHSWRTLPGTSWYVLEDDGIVAYGVVGKGLDLQGCLHEWAGEPSALPVLVSGILALRGDDRLVIMSPPDAEGAEAALGYHEVEGACGALAMIRVCDPDALCSRLDLGAGARSLIGDHGAFVRRVFGAPEDPDATGLLSPALYLTGLDSM